MTGPSVGLLVRGDFGNRKRSTAAASAAAAAAGQVSFEPESLPTVSVSADSAANWKGDLLAVAVTQEDLHTTGA
jgi:hypothetical protein